ncbi:DUF4184 family protein [Pontibacter sp. 172403-2]|uniref:DUF4184 family protein n=1 Tax=Pontibacter rufus TaxID=2791028 RepID=UPI0018AFAF1C|nr:DUF4184 family protein [Pontibacter sp. 172403-2]MBF9253356.1 DUF4184 family protein [Pontibacter sp. 172403-2]
MPFTAAHPAVILPLIHRRSRFLSATGLVVGAIVPDFEYFFEIEKPFRTSHTLPGIFLFNLPVAILIALLFHAFVREVVVEHLPPFLRKKIKPQGNSKWFSYLRRNWPFFLISIIIGTLSHLLWDSFTELDGRLLEKLSPFLVEKVFILGFGMERGRILQHLSTAAGLVVVIWYIMKQPAVRPQIEQQKVWEWLKFWVMISLFALLYLYLAWPKQAIAEPLTRAVVILISGGLLGLLFLSLVYRLKANLARA